MSKSDSRAAIDSELRELFGVLSFDYEPEENPTNLRPVRIEMLPLNIGTLIRFSDVIATVAVMHYIKKQPYDEIVRAAGKDLLEMLRPLVSVQGAKTAITIDMLPEGVLPLCLQQLLRSFSLGKWRALGAEIADRFGLDLNEVKAKLEQQTPSSESPEFSET